MKRLGTLFVVMLAARQGLEFLISVPPTGSLFIDMSTVLHAGIFYTTFFVVLALCLAYFTEWKKGIAMRRVFTLSPLLLAAPLIDWLFFGRYGVSMSYHFVSISDFVNHFFSFFGPMTQGGVTFGMRIQVLGIIMLFGWWVYRTKVSIGHALLAMLATYGLIYAMASAPSYIGWIEWLRTTEWSVGIDTAVFSAINSSVARVHDWGVGDSITILRFNMVMAELWFSVLALLGAWNCRKAIRALYTKSRALRAGLYVGFCALGAALAPSYLMNIDINVTAATAITVITAVIVVVSAWTYAFVINDLYDVAADEIVHQDRALPQGLLTRAQTMSMAKNAALLAVLGSIALSQTAFFAISFFIWCATIYSVPPTQARRFFAIPQLIMSFASLAIFYTGFELVAKDPIGWDTIRIMIALGFLLFGFWFFKDVPDMEGDQRAGYDTVMTWFGVTQGPWAAYGIFVISSIIPMAIFANMQLIGLWAALHAIVASLIQRGRFSEQLMPIFLVLYTAALVGIAV